LSVSKATVLSFCKFLIEVSTAIIYPDPLLWRVYEHIGLRLKVFNTEIRSQYILSELLLQFFLDLLPKPLMDLRVFRVQFGKND